MALQYSPEQLMSLRNSLLVHKPAGLPPAEEWMGPPPDQIQQKRVANNPRGRSDGSFSHGENANSRPLLEARHLAKGASNGVSHSTLYALEHADLRRKGPGEIILGPPKTSFASASAFKPPNAGFDSPNKSAFGAFGGETRGDYFSKGRFNSDRSEAQDDRQRDLKLGTTRNVKEDTNTWSNRPGRNTAVDEERAYRRNGGRDGEHDIGETGRRTQQRGLESSRGDESRRAGTGRGSRPSWYRDEDGTEPAQRENNADNNKSRGWREGEKGTRGGLDRDWNRGAKSEQEPEWMANPKTEQKKEKHSAQDIEQWKASMKARDMGGTQSDSTNALTTHTRTTSGPLASKSKLDMPLAVDPSLDDKFLQFWNESSIEKGSSKSKAPTEFTNPTTGRSNAKSSKFTGFFSPQAIATPAEPEAAPSPLAAKPQAPVDPVNEDKAGFQRILQMLAGPQAEGHQQPTESEILRSRTDTPPKGTWAQPSSSARSPPPILSPRSRRAHDLENLLGLQSPRESGAVPTNKDSEFLLNLLRPRDQGANQTVAGGRRGHGPKSSGLPSQPEFLSGPYHVQKRAPEADHQQPHFFEESMLDDNRPREQMISSMHAVGAQRQHAPFDDSDEGSVFPPQFSMGIPPQTSQPPGLQRPPGFDQMQPPPGFPPFLQQQRGPNMVAPPPGFGGAPPRNSGSSQFPPGLIPHMNNTNLGNERGPGFNIRHIGPSPGGPPPPGFMGMGGPPPPGFPMMGMPQDAFFAPGRSPMDNFGEPGQFGNGGRGAPTGQFQRPE